jgi:heme/copper-type cytochrome/quinol oxidase subunit 2
MGFLRRFAIHSTAVLCLLLGGVRAAAGEAVDFTVVNVDYGGTRFWLPSTLVVKRGTKVTVKLLNNVPGDPAEHGFAIPAYNVATVVPRGEPRQVQFTADREGVFPVICQLHPAHVGGQLVVLP